MFNFFPNTYVIIVLYILAAFFYSRFEYWLKVGWDTLSPPRGVLLNRYTRRNLVLFSILFVAAVILTFIDAVMSVYIIE